MAFLTRDSDPFGSMRREIDRLFHDATRGWSGVTQAGVLNPRVNLAETASGLELTAELPGVKQEDITLDLTDGVLTLQAATSTEKEEKDEKRNWHLVERASGTFMRRFALPFAPRAEDVKASFEAGVLKVMLPRPPEAPKQQGRISIGGA